LKQKDQPPRVMMREEFQQLAELRAEEAAILATNGKEQGAYYLAGLAVECALKACIAKRTRQHQYPPKNTVPYYGHRLDVLLELAELQDHIDKESKGNPAFKQNWGVVREWNVDARYEIMGLLGTEMVTAVNSADGVLQWLKRHW
jgi:HEPN domain-containing protein